MTITTAKALIATIALYGCLSVVGWQYRDHPAVQRHLNQFQLTQTR
jgi:hypothetical protein